MLEQIPTMRRVKDEAGNPLERITKIQYRTENKLVTCYRKVKRV